MKKVLFLFGYLFLGVNFLHSVGLCSGALLGAEAQEAIPLTGSGFGPTGPVVSELDNDSSNGLETAVVTLDGRVQVVRSDGTIAWTRALPNVTCAQTPSTDKSHSSPAVGELFGDGVKYVVVGYGGFKGRGCDGGVVAYRAHDGYRRWVFSIRRWARLERFSTSGVAVYGTPRLGDVDGDGKLEVGFGSFDRHIYLLNSNGSVRWYAIAADSIFSSPSFVDVNGDGTKEMIISTDISQNTKLRPPTPDGGYVYALNAAIKVAPGFKFGFRDPRLQVWRTQFDQTMQASPVVGDVIGSNPGPEVVVGSGCFFPQGGGVRRGKWFKVLSAKTGKVLRTLSVSACTPTPPGLGDLDQDGVLDVIGTVSGTPIASGDGTSHLIAWSPNRSQILWDVTPMAGTRTDVYGGHFQRRPLLTDLTGDGVPEILITHSTDVLVYNAAGEPLTCDSRPCTKPQFRATALVKGYVSVNDIDGDGLLEISAVGPFNGKSSLIRWENPF